MYSQLRLAVIVAIPVLLTSLFMPTRSGIASQWSIGLYSYETVAQNITLIGKYPVGSNVDIWIVERQPLNGKYYVETPTCNPQPAIKNGDGQFEARIRIGENPPHDDKFQLFLMTVNDPELSQTIEHTLLLFCNKSFPGFISLPGGMHPVQSVWVKRLDAEFGPPPSLKSASLPGTLDVQYPPPGETPVPATPKITGTYSHIDFNTTNIWILVYAPDGLWYPQATDPCDANPDYTDAGNHTWSVSGGLGTAQSSGEPFYIVGVLADQQANNFFQQRLQQVCAFQTYTAYSINTIFLPKGIMQKFIVRVIRQ